MDRASEPIARPYCATFLSDSGSDNEGVEGTMSGLAAGALRRLRKPIELVVSSAYDHDLVTPGATPEAERPRSAMRRMGKRGNISSSEVSNVGASATADMLPDPQVLQDRWRLSQRNRRRTHPDMLSKRFDFHIPSRINSDASEAAPNYSSEEMVEVAVQPCPAEAPDDRIPSNFSSSSSAVVEVPVQPCSAEAEATSSEFAMQPCSVEDTPHGSATLPWSLEVCHASSAPSVSSAPPLPLRVPVPPSVPRPQHLGGKPKPLRGHGRYGKGASKELYSTE